MTGMAENPVHPQAQLKRFNGARSLMTGMAEGVAWAAADIISGFNGARSLMTGMAQDAHAAMAAAAALQWGPVTDDRDGPT